MVTRFVLQLLAAAISSSSVFAASVVAPVNQIPRTHELGRQSREAPLTQHCATLQNSQTCVCESAYYGTDCVEYAETCADQGEIDPLLVDTSNAFGIAHAVVRNDDISIGVLLEIVKVYYS